jgi:hypothetical protein
MGALSFKGQFVPKVQAGLKNKPNGKRQSIRNYRKRPLKVGETVYLYFAMRTKWCKKIGESIIKSVQDILITEKGVTVYNILSDGRLKFSRAYTSKATLDKFAKSDGFRNWETMKRWWKLTHGPEALPFRGNLYKW